MRWFEQVWSTSSHMCAAGVRKCATSLPDGGFSRPTVHASGRRQFGQVVETSTAGSPGTRLGTANESHAQPPHHSVWSPMTAKPIGTEVNG